MKRLVLLAAAALIMATLVPQEASAQRGRGFVGGGGWRVAAVGGYRGGLGIRGGYGIRTAAFGPRYGIPGALWGPGWGFPFAAGVVAASYYGYGGYDYGYGDAGGCLVWDGYQWANACTGPYAYRFWW